MNDKTEERDSFPGEQAFFEKGTLRDLKAPPPAATVSTLNSCETRLTPKRPSDAYCMDIPTRSLRLPSLTYEFKVVQLHAAPARDVPRSLVRASMVWLR